jgi:hypothetical protein
MDDETGRWGRDSDTVHDETCLVRGAESESFGPVRFGSPGRDGASSFVSVVIVTP